MIDTYLSHKTIKKRNRSDDSKSVIYSDDIITLDFETSSLFYINDKWQSFDYSINKDAYSDIKKCGIAYAWAMTINGNVIDGRTLEDLFEVLRILNKYCNSRKIIYIQNLSFDFHFLINIIKDFEPFARKPHEPMYAVSKSLNLEFRCSYMLTGYSLQRYAEVYKLDVKKAVGDLDYTKARHHLTPLTKEEKNYLYIDVILLHKIIEREAKDYNHIYQIPLTKTGKVRNVVKKLYDISEKKEIQKMMYKDFNEFKYLSDTFSGGYTHANSLYVGEVLKNVFSKDLTSSYPAVMLQCKYPMSKFVKVENVDFYINDDNYCKIMKVCFSNLKAKLNMSYLSESKGLQLNNELSENGRIIECTYGEWWLSDVDLEIIKYSYDFDDMYISHCYIAYAGYLPEKYRRYIIELYQNKNSLKNVKGMEDVYMMSKEFLNSLYGMMATITLRDEVSFNGEEWSIEQLTMSDIEDKIDNSNKLHNCYLSYGWAVYVTAHARKRLWDMVKEINSDVVYTDTDSIKYLNDHEEKFNIFNSKISKLNDDVARQLNIDRSLLNTIGEYDGEDTSYKFITYGAKKYACHYIKGYKFKKADGSTFKATKLRDIKVTVSGLNKFKGSQHINQIEEFNIGKEWGYHESGRSIASYFNNQEQITFTDYLGNTATVNQAFGINIMPTTYTLGIANTFNDLVEIVKAKSSVTLSQIDNNNLNSLHNL